MAEHDWKYWAEQTGYKDGKVPDLETFMSYKILGKYTPMDLEAINSWFVQHPDAVLVTDKTNDAVGFSRQFIDKKRLMMELFSWDAVTEALQTDIASAMPSYTLLQQLKREDVSGLIELGVTAVASSRRLLEENKDLVESFVSAGIRIYAFHINFDEGKDEEYVVCNENQYFFGLYADNWNIGKQVQCRFGRAYAEPNHTTAVTSRF